MSISLVSKDIGSITVYDGNSPIYSNQYSFDDLKNKAAAWDIEPSRKSLFRACFIPTGSPSHKELVKNFLSPTLFYRALNVHNLVLRILTIPFAIILDIATLLPRIVIACFKLDPEFKSPIFSSISHELDRSFVKLRIQYEKVVIKDDTATKLVVDESREIALNPYVTVDRVIKYKNKESTYHNIDGVWDMQSNYDVPPKFFSYKN